MSAYDTVKGCEGQELNLSILRKYYKGKRIHTNRIDSSISKIFVSKDKPYNVECFFDEKENTVEIEYSYVQSWSGDDTSYDVTIILNSDGTIKTVSALHGRRFCYSDVRVDEYKSIRSGDFDYFILDKILDFACSPCVYFIINNDVLYSFAPEQEYKQIEKYKRKGGKIVECVLNDGVLFVPNGIKTCDFGAFDECGEVTVIHIPNSTKCIQRGAFSLCKNLKRVFIPKSVEKIGVFDEGYIKQNCQCKSRGDFCAFNGNDDNITVLCQANSIAEKYAILFGIDHEILEAERFDYLEAHKARAIFSNGGTQETFCEEIKS